MIDSCATLQGVEARLLHLSRTIDHLIGELEWSIERIILSIQRIKRSNQQIKRSTGRVESLKRRIERSHPLRQLDGSRDQVVSWTDRAGHSAARRRGRPRRRWASTRLGYGVHVSLGTMGGRSPKRLPRTVQPQRSVMRADPARDPGFPCVGVIGVACCHHLSDVRPNSGARS